MKTYRAGNWGVDVPEGWVHEKDDKGGFIRRMIQLHCTRLKRAFIVSQWGCLPREICS